jgi:hypothetical protein
MRKGFKNKQVSNVKFYFKLHLLSSIHRAAFKSITEKNYAQPAALYEMAVLAWIDTQQPARRYRPAATRICPDIVSREFARDPSSLPTSGNEEKETACWIHKKTNECEDWLKSITRWEKPFLFDIRIRIKVQRSMETLRWFKSKKGWEI